MVRLIGRAGEQISTPDGMVTLNRNGEAFIRLASTVEFLAERIEAGGLVGFELQEPAPEPDGDTGEAADSKKKPKIG